MIATLIVSSLPPVVSAASATPQAPQSGIVVDIFSNDGRPARRAEAPRPSDVLNSAGTTNGRKMSRGFLLASPELVASMRDGIKRLQGMPLKNRKADFTLSLGVLEAMSAASEAEAHHLLARLPIRVERTVENATVTTTVFVRGNVKLRVTSPGRATLPPVAGTETSASSSVTSGPSASDDAGAYAPVAARGSFQSSCLDNPDDPCATQQDIDDALAAEAALQSDLDYESADFYADESACYSDGCCYDLSRTAGPDAMPPSCGWRYLEAAGGLLWAASGILGAVAVTVSPEPVSKLAIGAAYTNAAAGVAAGILGVRDAYNCHYYQVYEPLNWTALRIDPAEFRLRAMAALPQW